MVQERIAQEKKNTRSSVEEAIAPAKKNNGHFTDLHQKCIDYTIKKIVTLVIKLEYGLKG